MCVSGQCDDSFYSEMAVFHSLKCSDFEDTIANSWSPTEFIHPYLQGGGLGGNSEDVLLFLVNE